MELFLLGFDILYEIHPQQNRLGQKHHATTQLILLEIQEDCFPTFRHLVPAIINYSRKSEFQQLKHLIAKSAFYCWAYVIRTVIVLALILSLNASRKPVISRQSSSAEQHQDTDCFTALCCPSSCLVISVVKYHNISTNYAKKKRANIPMSMLSSLCKEETVRKQ